MKPAHSLSILSILVLGMVIQSGCVDHPREILPVAITTPEPRVIASPVPVISKNPAPVQVYTKAHLTVKPETRPSRTAFGFTMDYPQGWNLTNEHIDDWTAGYNFSSPDGQSVVLVAMADERGSADHLEPLAAWAESTAAGLTQPYCHDGAGNPTECSPSEPGSAYHFPVLAGNDPVSIKGDLETRRLVITSQDDPVFRHKTIYLALAGKIRGYNFTSPGHYEVAEGVTGPAWDYGMGGLRYRIIQSVPESQVNATSALFRHMAESFTIIA